MLLRANRLLLGVWVAAGLAFPAMAQQSPPPAPSQPGLLCDAFTKTGNGEWVAKKDVLVPGPGGMVLVKAGQPVNDETQERLLRWSARRRGRRSWPLRDREGRRPRHLHCRSPYPTVALPNASGTAPTGSKRRARPGGPPPVRDLRPCAAAPPKSGRCQRVRRTPGTISRVRAAFRASGKPVGSLSCIWF